MTKEASAQWRLDIVAHGDSMTGAAHDQTADMNEARFLVHNVMAHALANVSAPVTRGELDSALGKALRCRAEKL